MSESSSSPETQRLAEIAARLEAATWLGVLRGAFEIATPRYEIGHVKYSALPHAENVANATLIANAPADLRLLLDHCAALESRLLTLEAKNAALKAELAGALPDGAITREKDGWWSVRGDVRQFRDANDARFAYMTAHARSTESSNG